MTYKLPLFLILLSFSHMTFGQEAPTIEKQYIKAIEKLAKNKKIQRHLNISKRWTRQQWSVTLN